MRIGLIGVGVMGSNHARVLSEMKDIDVVISDINVEVLEDVGERFNIKKRYKDHKDMLKKERLDGVVIAVPSDFHKKIVFDCIDNGIKNILVEKPIAHNLKEAEDMIKKAEENNVFMAVGHIERFNPVVSEIKRLLDNNFLGKLYLINTTRIGPFPKRLYGLQQGVLIDLAVHDVDIIRNLTGNINQVYAQIISNEEQKQEIYARCLFKINKINASSEFSWISPRKLRIIEVYGERGMLRGNYQEQTLYFYENSEKDEDALTKGKISEGNIIKYRINKQEPLKIELKGFIDAIKSKDYSKVVSSEDALEALRVALKILKSSEEKKPIAID